MKQQIEFNRDEQHFYINSEKIMIPDFPITVTLQITRRCNLKCIYCSEADYITEPTFEDVKKMIENLKGVKRVIVSGGEPLLRDDVLSILKLCRDRFDIVAMASNAILIDKNTAKKLSKYVDYVDVTIDGPRNIHNKIRGSYDKVLRGIWNLNGADIEYSIVMVLLNENKNSVLDVCQIADTLGATKLKLLSPIPKSRGKKVISQRLSSDDIKDLFENIKKGKKRNGWNIRITITDWNRIKEGHALLVHPNGDVVASPVWSKESCIEGIGNVINEDIKKIWTKYPYKENHIKKYIEKTLMVV
jgi:MoaA/NifB/PqqE/SkfB family radical SAM enzyme